MTTTFAYEQVHVYQRALAFCGGVCTLTKNWESWHAIADHLPRAAESVVVNLAESCAVFSQAKRNVLDYSLGSTLECAACLDIAGIKTLLDSATVLRHKKDLAEVFRMMVGLRSSWGRNALREEPVPYASEPRTVSAAADFHHEALDVYRVALDVMVWFCANVANANLPANLLRRLDASATSILLNLAEGNGRFSELDHRRFLDVAYRSAVKMAAQLDLCVQMQLICAADAGTGKGLLVRVASMTVRMAQGK
jgi:four helix bundle protein